MPQEGKMTPEAPRGATDAAVEGGPPPDVRHDARPATSHPLAPTARSAGR